MRPELGLATEFEDQGAKGIDFVRLAEILVGQRIHGGLGTWNRKSAVGQQLRIGHHFRHVCNLPEIRFGSPSGRPRSERLFFAKRWSTGGNSRGRWSAMFD